MMCQWTSDNWQQDPLNQFASHFQFIELRDVMLTTRMLLHCRMSSDDEDPTPQQQRMLFDVIQDVCQTTGVRVLL